MFGTYFCAVGFFWAGERTLRVELMGAEIAGVVDLDRADSSLTRTPGSRLRVVGRSRRLRVGGLGRLLAVCLVLFAVALGAGAREARSSFSPAETAAATVSTVDSAGDTGGGTSIAIGRDGLALISYSSTTDHALKVFHCSNIACTHGVATTLDPDASRYTSLTIGSDGFGLIAYAAYDRTSSKVFHCSNPTCSQGAANTIAYSSTTSGISSVAVSGDGYGIISYSFGAYPNEKFAVYHCLNISCSSGESHLIDEGLSTGYGSSIVIREGGLPDLAYYDSFNHSLKFFRCSNYGCSAGNMSVIDNNRGTNEPMRISMKMGSDGLPIMTYVDNDGWGASFALFHCLASDCSSGTKIKLSGLYTCTAGACVSDGSNSRFGAYMQRYMSLEIGINGYPIVVGWNGTVNIGECHDVSCSRSSAERLGYGASGNSGFDNSIAIGSDGFPIIAFKNHGGYLESIDDLMVVHCENSTCAADPAHDDDPPAVSLLSPRYASTSGGTKIYIGGSGFKSGTHVDIEGSAYGYAGNSMWFTGSVFAAPAHSVGSVDVAVVNPDGQSVVVHNGLTYHDPPAVTAVSPTALSLAGGELLTVTGTRFAAGASVLVGYAVCTSVTVVSATMVTCIAPRQYSIGSFAVKVTNSDLLLGSLAAAITVQASSGLTVSAASPSAVRLAGGTQLTLTGTGFATGATATVGGNSCTSLTVVSATSITCTAPSHGAGAVSVVVTNTDSQTGTLASAVTYQAAPTVTAVSPTGLPLAGGSLTITGTGFLTGATATVGGNSCTSLTVVSATSITCTAPSHGAGVVDVVVSNSDSQSGTLSGRLTYRVGTSPSVSGVVPSVVRLAGGTAIVITGTGFAAGATVTVGGVSCASVVLTGSTLIRCGSPAHSAGTVAVVVTNTTGFSGTRSNAITYQAAPTVTAVSPTVLPLAGGSVTLTGTGFADRATATVGGASCSSLSVESATSITCTAPAHAAGAVPVVVTNTDSQTGTLASAVTYRAAPTVTSVGPVYLPLAGGVLAITGTGFLTGATATAGGAGCTSLTVVSATRINCTAPSHGAGAVSVAVTNTDSQTGTRSTAVTYRTAAPTVTAVSPTGLPLAGGSVTVTGTGFAEGATVKVGSSACTSPSVESATSITCTAPAHAAGAVPVVVTNTDSQTGTLASAVTYRAAPTVTSVGPVYLPLAGGVLAITGTGFLTGATATAGGAGCTSLTVVSATRINCTAPSHGAGAVSVAVTNTDNQTGTRSTAATYR